MANSVDRIRSGRLGCKPVWVRCRVTASFKPGEAVVSINAQDLSEPLDFFVDTSFVKPIDPPRGDQVEGEIQAVLLEEHNGTVLIQVPGEAVSYGPKIPVSRDLLATPIAS